MEEKSSAANHFINADRGNRGSSASPRKKYISSEDSIFSRIRRHDAAMEDICPATKKMRYDNSLVTTKKEAMDLTRINEFEIKTALSPFQQVDVAHLSLLETPPCSNHFKCDPVQQQQEQTACNHELLSLALTEASQVLNTIGSAAVEKIKKLKATIDNMMTEKTYEGAKKIVTAYLTTHHHWCIVKSLRKAVVGLLKDFELFEKSSKIPQMLVDSVVNLIWASPKVSTAFPMFKEVHQQLVNKYGKELDALLNLEKLAIISRIDSLLHLSLVQRDIPQDYIKLMIDSMANGGHDNEIPEAISDIYDKSAEHHLSKALNKTIAAIELEMEMRSRLVVEMQYDAKLNLEMFKETESRTDIIYGLKERDTLTCLNVLRDACIRLHEHLAKTVTGSLKNKLDSHMILVVTILCASHRRDYLEELENFFVKIYGPKIIRKARLDQVKDIQMQKNVFERFDGAEPKNEVIDETIRQYKKELGLGKPMRK